MIENISYDQFEFLLSNKSNKNIFADINLDLLNPVLGKYILSKKDIIETYINNLLATNKRKNTRVDRVLITTILNNIGKNSLFNYCLYYFVVLYSSQHIEDDTKITAVPVTIKIGKKLFSQFMVGLRKNYMEQSKEFISYREWVNKWIKDNTQFEAYLNDTVYAHMGAKIINILIHSDMIRESLENLSDKKHSYYVLRVLDQKLMSDKNKYRITNIPVKLPMVCEPKPYNKNTLGGYLLNDEKYSEGLFIEKKAYGISSELSESNRVYHMINNISSTPFKINTKLLDYLNGEGSKHNLLIDSGVSHKYEHLEKRTKNPTRYLYVS